MHTALSAFRVLPTIPQTFPHFWILHFTFRIPHFTNNRDNACVYCSSGRISQSIRSIFSHTDIFVFVELLLTGNFLICSTLFPLNSSSVHVRADLIPLQFAVRSHSWPFRTFPFRSLPNFARHFASGFRKLPNHIFAFCRLPIAGREIFNPRIVPDSLIFISLAAARWPGPQGELNLRASGVLPPTSASEERASTRMRVKRRVGIQQRRRLTQNFTSLSIFYIIL